MRKFILIFDVKRERKSLQVKINRALHKINAKKLQHSVWESENLDKLKSVANLINQQGGKANILEKKIML